MLSLLAIWLPIEPHALIAIVAGALAGRAFARRFLPGKLGEVLFAPLCFTPFYVSFFLVSRAGFDPGWKETGTGWVIGFLLAAVFQSGPMLRRREAPDGN
ncbi:MAG: hypothetical protein AAF682_05015 [Planctomycetota bacterium]